MQGDKECELVIKHLAITQLESGVEKEIETLKKSFPKHPLILCVLDPKQVNIDKATETVAKVQGVANLLIAGMKKK